MPIKKLDNDNITFAISGVQASCYIRKGGQVHINGKRPDGGEHAQYQNKIKFFISVFLIHIQS